MTMRWTAILLSCASLALAAQTEAPPSTPSSAPAASTPQAEPAAAEVVTGEPTVKVDDLVRGARKALDAQDYAAAEMLLSEATKLDPSEPSLSYNLGVARFRQGDFEGAARAFSRAAELSNDANLRAKAAFNQGTSTYAQALKQMQAGQSPETMSQPLKQSIDLVNKSLEQLKSAIEANPEDRDARANAELAHKVLKKLQELQDQNQRNQQEQQQNQRQQQQEQNQNQPQDQNQQQQQQQQQQQNDQQQQSQQQKDEQQEQQQQQSQSQQSEQENEQQRGQQQQQQQQQQSSQSEQQSQQQDEQEQKQNGGQSAERDGEEEQQAVHAKLDENEGDDNEEQQQASATPQREGEREGAMTREQAERLLQKVRDKQRERRAALAAQRAASRKPVARDW